MRHRHLHAAAAVAVVLLGLLTAAAARANVPSHIDGLIAFQRNDDARGEIWVLDPTAAAPEASAVRVTSGPEPEARPTFGPTTGGADPDWLLAYQRYANGNWDIWSRRTHGTAGEAPSFDAPAALVDGPGNQTEPAYSRVLQGTPLLAYVSDQSGRRELWLRDTAGTLTQLTTDGAGYAHPDFAGRYRPLPDADGDGLPDGWRIGLAFESTRGGTQAIWALDIEVDIDGRFAAVHDLRPVASGPGPLFEPSWQVTNDFDFADGSIHSRLNDIVFATEQSGTAYLDYVEEPWAGDAQPETTVTPPVPFADPAAIVRHPLTGNPGADSDPVWAPDGDQVAFTRSTAGNSDIWTVQADGGNPRRLTSGVAPDLHPSWQPGSESSVDKVGGHTEPGPVDRSHGDGGKRDDGKGDSKDPGSQPRVSPRLRIGSVRWHARKVRLTGRTAAGVGQRLTVSFSCGSGAGRRSARLVVSRKGAFATTLKTKPRCRRARRGRVAVAYGGDARHTPERVTRRVQRR